MSYDGYEGGDEGVELEGIFKHGTERAVLIEVDGEDIWFPRSQIIDGPDSEERDDDCVLTVTTWIASEKGLG